ncbi:uncharacterized protein LOC134203451 [Armigeres subalbatus]|uniref:uncharacterized protein LOC134203451 n=1 Tax=Armigeres subalbatus TaxID=124917 RepID=UPI002ED49D6E
MAFCSRRGPEGAQCSGRLEAIGPGSSPVEKDTPFGVGSSKSCSPSSINAFSTYHRRAVNASSLTSSNLRRSNDHNSGYDSKTVAFQNYAGKCFRMFFKFNASNSCSPNQYTKIGGHRKCMAQCSQTASISNQTPARDRISFWGNHSGHRVEMLQPTSSRKTA